MREKNLFMAFVIVVLLVSGWGMWMIVKNSQISSDETPQSSDKEVTVKLSKEQKASAVNFAVNFIEEAGTFGFFEDIESNTYGELVEKTDEEIISKLTQSRVNKYEELDIISNSQLYRENYEEELYDELELFSLTSFEAIDISENKVVGEENSVKILISYTSRETTRMISIVEETSTAQLTIIRNEIPVEGTITLIGDEGAWRVYDVEVNHPYTLAFNSPKDRDPESRAKGDIIVEKTLKVEDQ